MESKIDETIESAGTILDLMIRLTEAGPFVFSLGLNIILIFGLYKLTKKYLHIQKVTGSLKISMMHILSSEMGLPYDEAKVRIKLMSEIEE